MLYYISLLMPANYGFHIEYSETHIVFTLRGRGENGGGQGRLGGGRGWREEGVDSEGSEGPLDGAGEVSDGLER